MDYAAILGKQMPPLYSQESKGEEAIVYVSFYSLKTGWRWYLTEGSLVDEDGMMDTNKPKVDIVFFGLANGYELELGYINLMQFQSTDVRRDYGWIPRTIADVRKDIANGHL